MVVRLYDTDLHAVGLGEDPGPLVTPTKATRVVVGFY